MELNAVLVRNKGFPITLARVEPIPDTDPPRFRRVLRDEETGEPVTRTVWVHFDGNAIADLEIAYGSTDAYQEALNLRPNAVIRQVLSLLLACPLTEVGVASIQEKFGEYLLALQMAWSVAMGMDPQQAATAMEVAKREMATQAAKAAAAVEEELAKLEAGESTPASPSPGENGSEPGSPAEETLSSSGG